MNLGKRQKLILFEKLEMPDLRIYNLKAADQTHLHRGSWHPSCSCQDCLGTWSWHRLKMKHISKSSCKMLKITKSGTAV
jgi:hypothetical protein